GFHVTGVQTCALPISPTQIVPTSVWDLGHRPKCDPTGMVEVIPGRLWVDIYLNSEDGQPWPNTVPLSRFGAMPLTGTEGYARLRSEGRRVGQACPPSG